MFSSLSEFLSQCQVSSQDCYQALKSILAQLENQSSRVEARKFLEELRLHLQENHTEAESLQKYHFYFIRLDTQQYDEPDAHLDLIQLPSVFDPETWSYTFFEGLTRYSSSEFYGRRMVELGCGNGWVTLSIAQRYLPQQIWGLDINPRAITSAKLNLYLNGLDAQGDAILDEEGLSLLDRVCFAESDLLEHLREQNLRMDRIVGCIPQVLNPDPDATAQAISEQESDEALYDLSNYCVQQGYVEDQFGLGLIARTLEDSVDLLTANGKVILNLGGRPGTQVLEKLFLRRGYRIRPVWQTKVIQAGDTDIQALVDIEQQTSHRFEFFMGKTSNESISAKTAQAYLNSGGTVAHSLKVIEGTLSHPQALKTIFHFLQQPNYQAIKPSLDLHFEEDFIADEKMSFLAGLSAHLLQTPHFSYSAPEGLPEFRRRIAEYLESYFLLPMTAQHVITYPSLKVSIKNILWLFRQGTILIDSDWMDVLPSEWSIPNPSQRKTPDFIEIPRRTHLICELIEKLKPQIALVRLEDYEHQTPDAFVRLLECSQKHHTRLFVDLSNVFEIYSTPQALGVFQYLEEHPLPPHCMILCGLIKDQVYPDLEVAFSLSENATLNRALTHLAELSYSRTPVISQYYFDQILLDLLKFHMEVSRQQRIVQKRTLLEETPSFQKQFISYHSACKKAFSHPSVEALDIDFPEEAIRLDFGENALRTPDVLKQTLFESFALQHIPNEDSHLDEALTQMLQKRFGMLISGKEYWTYGHGVSTLMAALMEACSMEKGHMLFPMGSYGEFIAMASFYEVPYTQIQTHETDHFKVTPSTLIRYLKETSNPWLYLNIPIVNPTGALYSAEEFYPLLEVAQKYGATVILDSIFSGLEFDDQTVCDLNQPIAAKALLKGESQEWVWLGGLSKEFAGGGLRFGFGATLSHRLKQALKRGTLSTPHKTLKYSVQSLLMALESQNELLQDALHTQRAELQSRQKRLCDCLKSTGWDVLEPAGGLFLIAKPTQYLGQTLCYEYQGESKEHQVTSSNVAQLMLETVGVYVNNDIWTEIPGYCRFAFSVSAHEFEETLKRLQAFHQYMVSSHR